MQKCVIIVMVIVVCLFGVCGPVLPAEDDCDDAEYPDPSFVQSDRRGTASILKARTENAEARKKRVAAATFRLRLFEALAVPKP